MNRFHWQFHRMLRPRCISIRPDGVEEPGTSVFNWIAELSWRFWGFRNLTITFTRSNRTQYSIQFTVGIVGRDWPGAQAARARYYLRQLEKSVARTARKSRCSMKCSDNCTDEPYGGA